MNLFVIRHCGGFKISLRYRETCEKLHFRKSLINESKFYTKFTVCNVDAFTFLYFRMQNRRRILC